MFRAYPSFVRPFSRILQELTRPTDRGYIAGVVKGEDSAAGAGIRGVPGKANSYLNPGSPDFDGIVVVLKSLPWHASIITIFSGTALVFDMSMTQ